MEDTLIELLETFEYPVIRQGSMSDDEEYPETFFTFWNNSEEEHHAYNNDTFNVVYDFDVNVYSADPDTAYTLLTQARTLLRENGWRTPVRAYDVASDEITHVGRGMTVNILVNESEV